jgi:hypothetical protein
LRNPRQVIINIPEEISIGNVEDTLLAQNTDINFKKAEIKAKFNYETRKHNRNLVMEESAQTRNVLLHKQIKLGWQICKIEDYVVATRCYKCSRFNHRARDCRGEDTCPLCTGSHKLKECKTNNQEYKCINCLSYNKQNQNTICFNHTSLDKNCPSLHAILEKQGKRPITDMGPSYNTNTNTSHCNRMYNTQIKFLQINLKHSRVATINLMKIIDEDVIDVLCIQAPCHT